ncbi:LacI family DNA-binding transcriptional regulator [Saccharopolyspora sp. TS4A08]|uniref:LacI family DNA-binding transcriptional regulator n=1 Tax=Saccharopolyspora ipomoeae TaxID=3042027 RepID=A0ABT6PHU4_9PSEU|nr:LacI family DNA-binding transcriptional regulator [Saccharopolyspora sp. TS4A08]MDI2027568.1 LacI family DNA-binding transcriptional regulator [Saccharopolyspora sp. TS4A08]
MARGDRRPTLETVAVRAGVSRATVSRVINDQPVAGPSRRAVERAIADIGYVPNQAARSLVTQRTGLIALVLPEPSTRVFSDDQFFPRLIQGVSQELETADEQLVLMLAGSTASRDRIQRSAVAGRVDGVMLASLHGADPLAAALAKSGIPVVGNERVLGSVEVPSVGVDNRGGARAAVEHLVSRGRRRIATIAGPLDMIAGIDRLDGYFDAIAGTQEPVVAQGDFTRESGEAAMERLLDEHPGVDAVFAASDLMAEGAMQVLRHAGFRVPEDVAVAGFDDITRAACTDPPLTTVRQPIGALGRHLAAQLLNLISGNAVEPARTLPTDLILRDST